MKRCSRCGESKPCDAFNRDRTTRDGLRRWCRSCAAAHHRGDLVRRTFLERVDEWRADAKCRGGIAVMFGSDVDATRAICATCTVAQPCLDAAIANREEAGVWAGVQFYAGKAKRLERERRAVAS